MADAIRITVAWSPGPGRVIEHPLEVPVGASVGVALAACAALEGFPALPDASLEVAVWGRAQGASHLLREGDRLELLRPLRVDPKVARRERFQKQGARAAGLFARRKPGTDGP